MIVQHATEFRTIVGGLIDAKQQGLIDHRESREILTAVLKEMGFNLAQRPSSPGGSATR